MNVGLAFARTALLHPCAIAAFDSRGDLTYHEVDSRSNQFANLAREEFGLDRGDRVALFLPNQREVVEVLVGCAKAGLVYVGLNFRLDDNELRLILENSNPKLLVTSAEFEERLRPFAKDYGFRIIFISDEIHLGYENLLRARNDEPISDRFETNGSDDFCIIYSSGTTGVPKGILFDHASAIQHGTITAIEYQINLDSRYLIQIPHNSSVNITIVPCILVGAAVGFAESRGFSPEEFADRVFAHAVTHSFVVPTMLYRILEKLDETDERFASLITLGYGSSSIPPEHVRELVARYGPIFIQLYGMAEIASIGTLLRKQDHVRALADAPQLLASAGRPSIGVEVRVVDSFGNDVQVGERGEVIFKGTHVMKEYFRDPKRTAEAVIKGWMHSGDIGVRDELGYLYIVDRMKDLIIRGGFNISPKEIEEVIYGHPDVLEVAVYGLPDTEWGESLCAAVALKEGRNLTEQDLIDWCRNSGLASIKVPQSVEVLMELPKNQVGKISKQELRNRLTERSQ